LGVHAARPGGGRRQGRREVQVFATVLDKGSGSYEEKGNGRLHGAVYFFMQKLSDVEDKKKKSQKIGHGGVVGGVVGGGPDVSSVPDGGSR